MILVLNIKSLSLVIFATKNTFQLRCFPRISYNPKIQKLNVWLTFCSTSRVLQRKTFEEEEEEAKEMKRGTRRQSWRKKTKRRRRRRKNAKGRTASVQILIASVLEPGRQLQMILQCYNCRLIDWNIKTKRRVSLMRSSMGRALFSPREMAAMMGRSSRCSRIIGRRWIL